jgi:titin
MMPTHPRSSSLSKPISITPLQKPQFAKHLQNVTTKQGNRALMQCTIKGSPDTTVSWYKNGKLIEPSTDYVIHFDRVTGVSTLDICEAFPQDSGQYTCVANNPAGNESTTAWLVVKGKKYKLEYFV